MLFRSYGILHRIPVEGVLFLMARSRKEHIRRNISKYLASLQYVEIEVSGTDLQELGIEPGPIYAQILEKLMEMKIDGVAETREVQLKLAQQLEKDLTNNSNETDD